MRVNIIPLSVNGAWQGRRFKTPAYVKFQNTLLTILPNKIYQFNNNSKLKMKYIFGFSSKLSDLANPEKLVTDILCKKYGFDDRQIYLMTLEKVIVPKGAEFIDFEISEIKET